MNTLFNRDGAIVPPRPDADDSDIKLSIIKQAVEDLFVEKHCEFEKSEKEDLIQSLHRHWEENCDEYELAKNFESDNWLVNYDFVSKLENVCGYVDSALKATIDEWANSYDIIPPFEIGTKLEEGVIAGISEYDPATYRVLVYGQKEDSTMRRLIKFEDAKAKVESTNGMSTCQK
ncbi:hypothetical protein VSVS12_03239 [Vibrio scophthalmi]|uniref:hypothetical protein n=1 Tax=Vibrio scophthalmi TaxID=45658 RepID=UPI0008093163|nr:hypothetical protein [Vibrio scophthalmi]ANS86948.1 hypothetical protein VSVS12_03239 [Vibrio scophthalmi]